MNHFTERARWTRRLLVTAAAATFGMGLPHRAFSEYQDPSPGSGATRSATRPAAASAKAAADADAQLERKLDHILANQQTILANQQAILQRFNAVMEELRIIKVRTTLRAGSS